MGLGQRLDARTEHVGERGGATGVHVDVQQHLLAGGEELDSSPEDRPQVVWQSGKPAFEGDPKGRRRIVQIFRPFVASWETGGIVS